MTATANVPLYELANARDILDALLFEAGGELTPEIEQRLNDLEGRVDDKVERVALYVREQLAIADAIEMEIRRLGGLLAERRRAAEGLKAYLKSQMERLDRKKVQGRFVTVTIQANSAPSVTTALEGAELWALDDARPFMKREDLVEYSIDRALLLARWKVDPGSIPAAFRIEQGSHLRLR
jgi:hypothetical protein